MAKRLEAVGVRSVNNVVDATNYAMLETGQPPHAFDYEKIAGRKIIVRNAIAGERIVSIDGTKCDLKPDMLIIADDSKPVAIAGIMGGLDTEVSDSTKTILLEDAHFDPVCVRTAARALSLTSESSYRFERCVDVENIEWASARTAQLICIAAGGAVLKGIVDCYPQKPAEKKVELKISEMNKLLGIQIPANDTADILGRLGFAPQQKSDDTISCTVPTWRSDIYRQVDLIEEVIRHIGYDKVPTDKRINIEVAPVDTRQKCASKITFVLNSCGFYETISVSFTDQKQAKLITGSAEADHLAVKDVSRKSANLLRPSLIGSLFEVMSKNYNAANKQVKIYELADTFNLDKKRSRCERTALALACDDDFRKLRGVIEAAVASLNKELTVDFVPADIHWAKSGAEILADGQIIGTAGIANEKICDFYNFKDACICAAELDFEILIDLESSAVKFRPIPKYPSIARSLSLIVDEQTSWKQIAQLINKSAPTQLEKIGFDGIYRGKPIEPGKKSITASLSFRDDDGTLTHTQVDDFENKIMKTLQKKIGAALRTA